MPNWKKVIVSGSSPHFNNITASANISASGLLFASSSVGNYSDVVVQDTASGRFYTTSSAALTTTLPGGLLSSSAQIASDISGAANGITGSLLSSHTFLSSSTQIAADISGSWQGQNFISASQTFLSTGQRSGSAGITGSLTVTGTITAQEFHTEFVSSSILYESGSTKFGDTSDDIHQFSGSLRVTGSGDHYILGGNVGIGTSSPTQLLHVDNPSGASSILLEGASGYNSQILFRSNPSAGQGWINYDFGNIMTFGVGNSEKMRLTTTSMQVTGNITASGNISSSGMGTFAQVRVGESTTTNYGLIVDYPDTRLLQLKVYFLLLLLLLILFQKTKLLILIVLIFS